VQAAAHESIGGARATAGGIPGGEQLVARASSAFTDAFTLTNKVAIGIALAAAAVVLLFARRGGELPAESGAENLEELAVVGVDDMRE
jgi:hypothetical protein